MTPPETPCPLETRNGTKRSADVEGTTEPQVKRERIEEISEYENFLEKTKHLFPSSSQKGGCSAFLDVPRNVTPWEGTVVPSAKGVNTVLRYRFGAYCYCFSLQRAANRLENDVFMCVGCRTNKPKRNVPIAVIGTYFQVDPVSVNHVCKPKLFTEDYMLRLKKGFLTHIRQTKGALKGKEVVKAMAEAIEQDDSLTKEEITTICSQLNYRKLRSGISKAAKGVVGETNSSTDIPPEHQNICYLDMASCKTEDHYGNDD